jgi:Protein of unknown function (DUF3617)
MPQWKAACIRSWVLPSFVLRLRIILLTTIALLGTAAWTPSEAAPVPGIYEIETQLLMPNLEENLRYADTQVRRCIRGNTAPDFFPVLQYASLNGCTLTAGKRREDTVNYPLVCRGFSGTTGAAWLQTQGDHVEGTLDIKMGGKNMTFSQHIEATRQGKCNR